jgi:hypothetical protein
MDDGSDLLFPWYDWAEEEGASYGGALYGLTVLRRAQESVLEMATGIRAMVEFESDLGGEFLHVELEEHDVWLAVSTGDHFYWTVEAIKGICMADVSTAAGFTASCDTPVASVDPDRATIGRPEDRARVFGVTLAHAVEEAATTGSPVTERGFAYADWTAESWLRDIAKGGEGGGKVLLRWAGRGLNLCSALRGFEWTEDGESLYRMARDIATGLDDGTLNPGPIWRSHSDVVAALEEAVRALKPASAALTGYEAVDEQLARDTSVGPLATAILALTDLHGWGVSELLESDPEPILPPRRNAELTRTGGQWGPAPERESRRRGPFPFHVVVGEFDVEAARKAARELGSPYPELDDDIALLDAFPDREDNWWGSICDIPVRVAETGTLVDSPDLMSAITRLGAHGILMAAGAVWCTPRAPVVSQFSGIMIVMYPDDDAPRHFHARDTHGAAKIKIKPVDPIDSTLRQRELRLVLAWAELNQEELLVNWRCRKRPWTKKPWTIPPLR